MGTRAFASERLNLMLAGAQAGYEQISGRILEICTLDTLRYAGCTPRIV
jgi:hypothetical protein